MRKNPPRFPQRLPQGSQQDCCTGAQQLGAGAAQDGAGAAHSGSGAGAGASQDGAGAAHVGAGAAQVGSGAAQVGAGAQQVGSGAQQPRFFLPNRPNRPASAVAAPLKQTVNARAMCVHFISVISLGSLSGGREELQQSFWNVAYGGSPNLTGYVKLGLPCPVFRHPPTLPTAASAESGKDGQAAGDCAECNDLAARQRRRENRSPQSRIRNRSEPPEAERRSC